MPAQVPEEGEPLRDTAPDLRDFWLRFHEADLCQALEAVFVFHPTGVEIWCVVEDERSFEKLNELLAPLRSRYQIAAYPTRLQPEKKSLEDRNPPPSLWNNGELRTYLSDPFASAMNAPGEPNSRVHALSVIQVDVLKQRMIMFAEETLDWDRRLKRYAADLPALTQMATDSSLSPETRARASSICLAHAQAVDRLASHLNDNLSEAFPRGSRRPKSPAAEDKADERKLPPVESAQELANSALAVAKRVYRFIHPQRHTVGLVDLREPSLLEELPRSAEDGGWLPARLVIQPLMVQLYVQGSEASSQSVLGGPVRNVNFKFTARFASPACHRCCAKAEGARLCGRDTATLP